MEYPKTDDLLNIFLDFPSSKPLSIFKKRIPICRTNLQICNHCRVIIGILSNRFRKFGYLN